MSSEPFVLVPGYTHPELEETPGLFAGQLRAIKEWVDNGGLVGGVSRWYFTVVSSVEVPFPRSFFHPEYEFIRITLALVRGRALAPWAGVPSHYETWAARDELERIVYVSDRVSLVKDAVSDNDYAPIRRYAR